MKNDLKIRSERRHFSAAAADAAGIKLLSMEAHEVLQSTKIFNEAASTAEANSYGNLCFASETVIDC